MNHGYVLLIQVLLGGGGRNAQWENWGGTVTKTPLDEQP